MPWSFPYPASFDHKFAVRIASEGIASESIASGRPHPLSGSQWLSRSQEKWLPHQDSNLKCLDQNQMCCQLHHGVTGEREVYQRIPACRGCGGET